jgi:hypothetical protein
VSPALPVAIGDRPSSHTEASPPSASTAMVGPLNGIPSATRDASWSALMQGYWGLTVAKPVPLATGEPAGFGLPRMTAPGSG